MAVMASWNGKTWGVSSQRIAALNGVSHSVELDTENSDDKAGSPATKTKALKLQSMSFDFDLAAAVGCDVRSEYESWTALVGQYAPFYLAGRRFGPANLQLTGVSLSDTKLDNLGRILTGKITIKLTEYATQYAIVNVADLEAAFEAGAVVDTEALKAKGLVKKTLDGVKVLGNGELTKALTVKAAAYSASAKEKIEKAGGKAEVM